MTATNKCYNFVGFRCSPPFFKSIFLNINICRVIAFLEFRGDLGLKPSHQFHLRVVLEGTGA